MSILRQLRSLFRKSKLDADMSAEMQAHVDLQTERNVAKGMTPDDARHAALRQFGNVASIQQQAREGRSWLGLENWTRDFGLALRSLRRSPGFSVAVLLTLVLCLGPNTAVLSALHTLVLKPLPYADPAQLVMIKNVGTRAGNLINSSGVPQYLDFSTHADAFERLALFEMSNTTIGEDTVPTRVSGYRATAGLFELLGIAPITGRFFTADEETVGRDHVLVLTHAFWLKQYQGDPGVVGREVRMGGEIYTIIGIAPPALEALFLRVDFLKPYQYGPEELNPMRRYSSRAQLVGRMRPGVTVQDAQAQLATVEELYRTEVANPALRAALEKGGFRIVVERWASEGPFPVRQPLWMLQVGALLVLLIGAVNVANLMLARMNARRPEFAIRLALGAGWRALFRQMFCEVAVLVCLAATAGVAMGWSVLQVLNHSLIVTERMAPPVRLEPAIVGVVLVLGAGIALFIGLLPLVMLRRAGLRVDNSRTASAAGGLRTLSGILVVGQVALALVLLVGAGLLVRSFANVLAVDPGFDAARVVQGRIALSRSYDGTPENRTIRTRLTEAMQGIPGVMSVATSSYFGVGPASSYRKLPYTLRRQARGPDESLPLAYHHPVSAGFFTTMGARMVEGRDFAEGEIGGTQFGVIVDRTFAEINFPGRSALGEELAFGAGPFGTDFRWPRIIGVVDRVNVVGLEDRDGLPFVYTPAGREGGGGFNVLVRSTRPSADILAEMRAKLRSIDPTLPLYNTGTLRETLDQMLLPRRAIMVLLSVFAGLALLLAAVGLYGVLAYDVTQRTREIGIRGAIGASRAEIVGLILNQGFRKVLVGLSLGLVGSLILTRYLHSLLFDVQRVDPISYAGVMLLLLLVTLLASWLPAQRAAKVDPVVALRAE